MNPISPDGPWSLGTLIAMPLGILTALAAAIALTYAIRRLRNPDLGEYGYDSGDWWWAIAASTVVLLAAGIGTSFGMWPYDSEYHQWRPVTGQVQRIDKRLVGSGDGMSERYVVSIAGRPFAVDDSRAATLTPGDEVTLACKREWQYAANSGWGCRWAGEER